MHTHLSHKESPHNESLDHTSFTLVTSHHLSIILMSNHQSHHSIDQLSTPVEPLRTIPTLCLITIYFPPQWLYGLRILKTSYCMYVGHDIESRSSDFLETSPLVMPACTSYVMELPSGVYPTRLLRYSFKGATRCYTILVTFNVQACSQEKSRDFKQGKKHFPIP